jgi:hypothetical protein
MSDDKPMSPRAQRTVVFEELKVLERLMKRLLLRAKTHAGDSFVGKRIEEIIVVNDGLNDHVARLEAIGAQEEELAA